MVAPRRFGIGVGAGALVADQAAKVYLIEVMAGRGWQPIEVAPFFNLVMVWNRGISFGLFQGAQEIGRWGFSVLAVLVSAWLVHWLGGLDRRPPALGAGLLIGGALGNAVDRIWRGAVADFFDFHVAGWHWPAFNLADIAISVGVAFLLADSLFAARPSPK